MSTQEEHLGRRTSGTQRSGRAARVVDQVLQATGEELNRVGYAGLRVDEVAERAGVNKTTIYRRWPTKAELVTEAIRVNFGVEGELPNTGSLRGDLIAQMQNIVRGANDPVIRGVLTVLTNRTDPMVETLAKEMVERARQRRTDLVQRGIDRGELPKSTDAALVADLFSAPILRRLLNFREEISEDYIESVIDLVLAGAVVVALQSPK